MLYSEGLGPFRPLVKALPMSHEWGRHSGVRKAGYSVRTLKVRRQTGERTPTSLGLVFLNLEFRSGLRRT